MCVLERKKRKVNLCGNEKEKKSFISFNRLKELLAER